MESASTPSSARTAITLRPLRRASSYTKISSSGKPSVMKLSSDSPATPPSVAPAAPRIAAPKRPTAVTSPAPGTKVDTSNPPERPPAVPIIAPIAFPIPGCSPASTGIDSRPLCKLPGVKKAILSSATPVERNPCMASSALSRERKIPVTTCNCHLLLRQDRGTYRLKGFHNPHGDGSNRRTSYSKYPISGWPTSTHLYVVHSLWSSVCFLPPKRVY